MCLLIYKKPESSIPFEHLRNANASNPHGCGVAIADGETIHLAKSPKWGEQEIANVLDKWKGHPAIVHFRYATHGSKNEANTHPFFVDTNQKWVAAHNGVISSVTTLPDESDTRAFLRQKVLPLVERGTDLTDLDVVQYLGNLMRTSNKMVFMNPEGKYSIANEAEGSWDKDIWYSNCGYKSYGRMYEDWEYQGSRAYQGSYVPPARSVVPVTNPYTVGSELWHEFDTSALICDCCQNPITSRFKFEAHSRLIICDQCDF